MKSSGGDNGVEFARVGAAMSVFGHDTQRRAARALASPLARLSLGGVTHNSISRLCEGPRKPIRVCFCVRMESEWAPRSLYKI